MLRFYFSGKNWNNEFNLLPSYLQIWCVTYKYVYVMYVLFIKGNFSINARTLEVSIIHYDSTHEKLTPSGSANIQSVCIVNRWQKLGTHVYQEKTTLLDTPEFFVGYISYLLLSVARLSKVWRSEYISFRS